MNIIDDKLILVGMISSPHGIQGNITVISYTVPQKNLLNLNIINVQRQSMKLKFIRIHQTNKMICKLINCNNRNDAESFKNTKLYCTQEALPTLPDDEFYFTDLQYTKILDASHNEIGIIANVYNFGAGDIIEIKFHFNNKYEMFSFCKTIFPIIKEDYVIFIQP